MAHKALQQPNNYFRSLEASEDSISGEDFDKQTLHEHKKSELGDCRNFANPESERACLLVGAQFSKTKHERNPSGPLKFSSKKYSPTPTTDSEQEVRSSPQPGEMQPDHTDASSKTGLARHRNSIGLLTDNIQPASNLASHLTNKDTPCQTSSGNKESNLQLRCGHADFRKMSKYAAFTKLPIRTSKCLDKPSDSLINLFGSRKDVHILIEPLQKGSIANDTASNHQVPLVSRIPSSMMKRASLDRAFYGSKKKTKILARQEPVLAHHQGDTCLPQESGIAVEVPNPVHKKTLEKTHPNFRLILAKKNSMSAEESQFLNSRRFLDESSVRLQSIKGSVNNIPKKRSPSQIMAPGSIKRKPEQYRKFSFNFPSLRFHPDQHPGYQTSSRLNSGKSNICMDQIPAFEVSRMLLVVPDSFRSPSKRQIFASSKHLITPKSDGVSREEGETKSRDAIFHASPELDTNLDLGAMIRECNVLQNHLIKPNRA